MRSIGLHMRWSGEFSSVIARASSLSLPLFQAFLLDETQRYSTMTTDLITHYGRLRSQFMYLIAHSSFKINLAHPHILQFYALKKELDWVCKLQFSHLVFHPGAVAQGITRNEALESLVRNLNRLTKYTSDITFVLENSAHGKRALGGDIKELKFVQARLDRPEKVRFCIDTAHAYVFGYTVHKDGRQWIDMVCKELTAEAIALIHANDSDAQCGSFNDRHSIPGEGKIGKHMLTQMITHPLLQDKPIILELPVVEEREQMSIIQKVQSWCKGAQCE